MMNLTVDKLDVMIDFINHLKIILILRSFVVDSSQCLKSISIRLCIPAIQYPMKMGFICIKLTTQSSIQM